jgi:L-glyceraldehyde 3-phosphate reductase
MSYLPAESRYQSIPYRRCGRSGIKLPVVSLGLWHNYGGVDTFETMRQMLHTAFDSGITHFDLANNYGPPGGSAEENFGRLFNQDLVPYRDELIISTKAGYYMLPGPYGDGGSRKYLIASLDQSLKRMGLDYVDIFYSHRPDPETPLEETMQALDYAVRSGRALYVGISNYSADQTRQAAQLLRQLGTPALIHQPVYNMFNRWIEEKLLAELETAGMGCIPFSPLAQGLLTDRYLTEIPADSRAAKPHGFLKRDQVTEERLSKVRQLSQIAIERGQAMSQMAIAWVLRNPGVTSALIGASRPEQISDIVAATQKLDFTAQELQQIDAILAA